MTRTDLFKAIYFLRAGALLATGVGFAVVAKAGETAPAALLAAAFAVLALSGRVQAWFWSDLLAGLHHLNQRDYPSSKASSERFLATLAQRPWLKHLIWLSPSSYSANAEVLALNNLGAAEAALGETDAAREHLIRAIELDPQCPLPFLNMAIVMRRAGQATEAETWLRQAQARGYRGDWSDRRAQASQRNNAALSATGAAPGPWGPG